MKLNRLFDLLRMSMHQAFRRRKRYIGVIAAIILGTGGFVLIITESEDVKNNINKDLELLGGATVIKSYFDYDPAARIQWFYSETLRAIRDIPGVEKVGVVSASNRHVISIEREQYRSFLLIAADSTFWESNSFVPVFGRFFTIAEENARRRICVLGEELSRELFGERNPVGKSILIDKGYYEIIGVLGGILAGDRKNFAFIPLQTALSRIEDIPPASRIYIRCKKWDSVASVAAAITPTIERHQEASNLRVDVPWEQLRQVKKVAWWVELFIHLSVGVTLLLGGVGIWNVMMSSVRSRTREIGLKKAMGAEDIDILVQFLSEALCISIGASFLGVLWGRIGVEITSKLLKSPPTENLFFLSVVLSLSIALLLGLAAGILPAIRASKMEVVSALRYE